MLARLARALGDQYEVRGLLGRGGFAEVYEVWDRSLERRLALKVLRPDVAWTSGMLVRFKQEAKAVAQLAHSNILPIHFVGEAEGIVYYAMPFVEGQSLGDLLRSGGALSPDKALAIAKPILDALQHAHEKGLVHRDIKPDNIMIDRSGGRPLLVDFGIAKRMEAGKGLTQTGFVVGTPHYMSPEQALGQADLDARSDLYAMGAVIFQMVTGAPPFEGDTSQEIVAKHITQPPPLATSVNGKIPQWLSDVIVKCMAKKPNDRFQSAGDVSRALSVGRMSGPQEAVSAQRVAAAVQSNDRTAIVPSGQRPVRSSAVTTPMPRASAELTRPAVPRSVWASLGIPILVLLVVGGVAAYLMLRRPELVIQNHLVEPIRVSVGDAAERTLDPGAEMSVKPGKGEGAHWRLVRPVTPQGAAMGMELSGVLIPQGRGAVRRSIEAQTSGAASFSPLITNATDRPLTIMVNAGLQGSSSCSCTIPPGATRMRIGYYQLFQNSTVRAEGDAGRKATFADLGTQVDPVTGLVGLRFETKDLRR